MDDEVRETLHTAWIDFKQEIGIQLKNNHLDNDTPIMSFKETFVSGNPLFPIRSTLRIENRMEISQRNILRITFNVLQRAFKILDESPEIKSLSDSREHPAILSKNKIDDFEFDGQFFIRKRENGTNDFKVTLDLEGNDTTIKFESTRGEWRYDNKPKEKPKPSEPMLGPHRPQLVSREDWKKYLKENNLDITGSFFATEDTKLDALQALDVFKPQLENPDSRLRQRIMSILRT